MALPIPFILLHSFYKGGITFEYINLCIFLCLLPPSLCRLNSARAVPVPSRPQQVLGDSMAQSRRSGWKYGWGAVSPPGRLPHPAPPRDSSSPAPPQDWRLILDRNGRRQISDLGTPGRGKGPSWKEGLCETPNTKCLYTPMPTTGLVCCFILMVLPSGRRCGDFCLRNQWL